MPPPATSTPPAARCSPKPPPAGPPPRRGPSALSLAQLPLPNAPRYPPPVLPLDPGMVDEWEVLARLTLIASGVEADDPALIDDEIVRSLAAAAVADRSSPVQGRD